MFSKSRALFLLFSVAIVLAGSAGVAQAACLPDPPMDGDAVVCDGMDSTGYDGSVATDLTITTLGMATLDESNMALDSAILVSDDNTVTIGADATVTVTEINGFGIRGNDGNVLTNEGTISLDVDNGVGIRGNDLNRIVNDGLITITGDNGIGLSGNNNNFIVNESSGAIVIDGLNGRGISLNQNTNGILPNGGVNRGTITVNGVGGFAIETDDNAGVSTTGIINLNADNSRGISAGDRANPLFASNLSNTGFIGVSGDNSYGIKAGDGWVQGALVGQSGVSQAAIFTLGGSTITVSGDNSFGIFAGDELNMAGNNNSFVLNIGTINVTGLDSAAVSLGGQDLLDPFDSQGTGTLAITSFANLGTITGDLDSNPLVEFRSFVPGRENSVGIGSNGAILADTSVLFMMDRGVAIRGTDGDEFVFNVGEIQGTIELGNGDDTYVHGPGAILTDSSMGATVLGGGGTNDLAALADNSISAQSFDVAVLSGFETLEIGGGTFGWELVNTATFTDMVEIAPSGRLRVPTPITLGGNFVANPTGTVELTIDGMTAPLTVVGASTFAGDLIVRAEPGVTPGPTMHRAVDAMGGFTGQFEFIPISGNQLFAAFYDAAGVSVQLVSTTAVGVASGSTERAIARHLDDIDAIGSAEPTLQRLLDEFDDATGTLNNVFRALSPEIYDAHTTVIVDGARRVSNLLFDRPRECQSGETVAWQGIDEPLPCHARNWSPWLAAIGGVRSRESFGGHGRYDAQLGGLVFGVDVRPIENLDLTLAVSSQRGTIDGASRGKSTVTLTDLSGHAAWNRGPLRVQGTVGWGHGFHQDRRRVRFAETGVSTIDVRGVEEHDSDRISIAGEVGYVFDVGPVKVEPIGGLNWAWVYQRPIHEDETFGLGIRIASRDDSIGSINGGLRVSTSYLHSKYLGQQLLWMDGVWRPSIEVRWRQMLTGYEREIEARLQGAPDGVSDFTIEGREDPGGAEIAAGLSFTPKNANRLQFDVRYEAFLSSHAVTHDLIARAQIGF